MIRSLFSIFLWSLTDGFGRVWDYHRLGPDTWSDRYPSCAGQYQSPINILTACTKYKSFSSFQFSTGYSQSEHFSIENNGLTIMGTLMNPNHSANFQLKGGGLNGTFELANFHLHWGENYRSGSEHQV